MQLSPTFLTYLCTAIRPFSVVLMAKSAAPRLSPAMVEAPEGVGWLGRWFGGSAEVASHGFEWLRGQQMRPMSQKSHEKFFVHAGQFFNPLLSC
jgi:hypothetical protein